MIQQTTLLELNTLIKDTLYSSFEQAYWVVAEISELKINRNGHCYLELIEKDKVDDHIIARSRATIWAYTFRILKPYFENYTGEQLKEGLKVLIQVHVEFHEIYGLSLNVKDIDPSYTIGDLEQKKREILKQLEDEGVLNMNQELPFPIVPQHIAVISSETAAGYQDFINQLSNNNPGYVFFVKLFPAYMQGNNAEESIIQALDQIYEQEESFELVAIIRGGGAQADFNCFNTYSIASHIAQYPLPVITGIGHEKDESIADLVAHKKLKTPTAAAEYLIEKMYTFEERLLWMEKSVINATSIKLKTLDKELQKMSSMLFSLTRDSIRTSYKNVFYYSQHARFFAANFIHKKKDSLNQNLKELKTLVNKNQLDKTQKLDGYVAFLKKGCLFFLERSGKNLDFYSKTKDLLDPKSILKRGFSITLKDGKAIKSARKLEKGDKIETVLYQGKTESIVSEKSKK